MRVQTLLLVVLWLAATSAGAVGRLAVMPLVYSGPDDRLNGLVRFELEESFRSVASEWLAPNQWSVLPSELMVGEPTSSRCFETACQLDSARRQQAQRFASSEVKVSGRRFKATLRIVDAQSDKALASTDIDVTSLDALRAKFQSQFVALLQKIRMAPRERPKQPPPPPVPPRDVQTIRGHVTLDEAQLVIDREGLDRTAFAAFVRSRQHPLVGCYERDLRANPVLSGSVTVALSITPGGRAEAVAIVQDAMHAQQMNACLQRTFGQWRYPFAPAQNAKVMVPLQFVSEAATK